MQTFVTSTISVPFSETGCFLPALSDSLLNAFEVKDKQVSKQEHKTINLTYFSLPQHLFSKSPSAEFLYKKSANQILPTDQSFNDLSFFLHFYFLKKYT